MYRFIHRLHLYLGLLCAPYLVAFGLSSLHFNHHFSLLEPRETTVQWERRVSLPALEDHEQLALALRDSLGLMGWPLPWDIRELEDGRLLVPLVRPGKRYNLSLDRASGLVSAEEIRLGPGPIVGHMHAIGPVPNSGFSRLWPWYTDICTFFTLFAVASGIWFWHRRKQHRRLGWLLLAGAGGGSLLLMLFVYFRG